MGIGVQQHCSFEPWQAEWRVQNHNLQLWACNTSLFFPEEGGVTMIFLVRCDGLSVLPAYYFFPTGRRLDLYHSCCLWNIKWGASNRAEHLTLEGSASFATQPDESPEKVFKGYCPKENNFNDIVSKYTHNTRKWQCSWEGDIHKEFTSWVISRGDLLRLLLISDGLKTFQVLSVFFLIAFLSLQGCRKSKDKKERRGKKEGAEKTIATTFNVDEVNFNQVQICRKAMPENMKSASNMGVH